MTPNDFSKDVSIIILSWKDAQLLFDWFESFLKFQKPAAPSVEIFVCDNGSGNPEFDRVVQKYAKAGDFHFFKNQENEYIPAINRFVAMAQGRYIMLAAPGAPFLNDVVVALKEFLDKNPDTGAVSAKFYNPDLTFQNVYKKSLSLSAELFEGRIFMTRKLGLHLLNFFNNFLTIKNGLDPKEPFLIEKTHLCAFMLKRESLDEESLIDPKIPLGPCDGDLCRRIYKKGFKIYCVTDAKCFHHRSVSFSQHGRIKAIDFTILGALAYFKKHHPFQFILLKFLHVFDQLIQLILLYFARFSSIEKKASISQKRNFISKILKA